ncbi:hypothetical protein D6853_10290 [Butyrivibrio sp. X503]|uniref:hypothetical protein n=1 Tax=Butyrivibrio sp. X503 TaxID=2364878 RepID=UPI000EA83DD6|nr:hypothetical protein [Butyrivibrio sp. X503]RKM55118.1 hypothetical protein D6853_10290 [Butyrivibrio sp. X503]
MGLTDEEIKNATTKSSLTLEELACVCEGMIAEDKVYKNDGAEIALFKAVINGNAKDAYNKYGDKLDDGETKCWYGVSKYIMGTVTLQKNENGKEYLCGNVDEFKDQINAALGSDKPRAIMSALNLGSSMVALDSNYLAAVTADDCECYSPVYREYKKNMIINDTFTFLSCRLDDEAYGVVDDIYKDRENVVTNVTYDDGLVLTVESTEYSFGDEVDRKTYEMTVKYKCGPGDVSNAIADEHFQDAVTAAEAEQRNLLGKITKDGFMIGGAVAGGLLAENPEAGTAVVSYAYDAAEAIHDQSISGDKYKEYIDKSVKKLIDIDYKYASDGTEKMTGDAKKEYYSQASEALYDTYKYFSYTGLEDAQNEQADYYKVKYTGSVGCCYIDEACDPKKDGTLSYSSLHTGFVAPEYLSSFTELKENSHVAYTNPNGQEHTTEAHGLAKNWSPEFTEKMLEVMNPDNPSSNDDYRLPSQEVYNEYKGILTGGYDITKVENFEDLDESLEQIQDTYDYVVNLPEVQEAGYAPKGDGHNGDIRYLWGEQADF